MKLNVCEWRVCKASHIIITTEQALQDKINEISVSSSLSLQLATTSIKFLNNCLRIAIDKQLASTNMTSEAKLGLYIS